MHGDFHETCREMHAQRYLSNIYQRQRGAHRSPRPKQLLLWLLVTAVLWVLLQQDRGVVYCVCCVGGVVQERGEIHVVCGCHPVVTVGAAILHIYTCSSQ